MNNKMRSSLAVAALLAVCGAALAERLPLTVIGVSGIEDPELPGFTIRGTSGRLNQAGEVMLQASLSDSPTGLIGDSALWIGYPGQLQLTLATGQPAPGAPSGTIVDTFGLPDGFNSAGNIGGVFGLRGMRNGFIWSPDAIYIMGAGGPHIIAIEDDPAPGMGTDVVYAPYTFSGSVLDNLGRIGFSTDITGPGITSSNNRVAWIGSTSGVSALAREGEQTPGLDAGVLYGDALDPQGALANGSVVLTASLTGVGIDTSNNHVLLMGAPGALAPLARTSDPAPDLPAKQFTRLRARSFADDGRVLLNADFGASGTTEGAGYWTGYQGSLQLAAATGEQAPGMPANTTFSKLSRSPTMNANGVIGFVGAVTGPTILSTNDEAIWVGTQANLEIVAREGDSAPGFESGVVFDTFTFASGTLALAPAINANGLFAFRAWVRGDGITGANDTEGVWFGGDGSGMLHLVAKAGDTIEVASGDVRTIAQFNSLLGGEDPSDGARMQINDRNQLLVHVNFTDGTNGVLLTTIPAPGSGLVCSAIALLASPRQRRSAAPH